MSVKMTGWKWLGEISKYQQYQWEQRLRLPRGDLQRREGPCDFPGGLNLQKEALTSSSATGAIPKTSRSGGPRELLRVTLSLTIGAQIVGIPSLITLEAGYVLYSWMPSKPWVYSYIIVSKSLVTTKPTMKIIGIVIISQHHFQHEWVPPSNQCHYQESHMTNQPLSATYSLPSSSPTPDHCWHRFFTAITWSADHSGPKFTPQHLMALVALCNGLTIKPPFLVDHTYLLLTDGYMSH